MADLSNTFKINFFQRFITVWHNINRMIMVCQHCLPIIIIVYFEISKRQTWSNRFKVKQNEKNMTCLTCALAASTSLGVLTYHFMFTKHYIVSNYARIGLSVHKIPGLVKYVQVAFRQLLSYRVLIDIEINTLKSKCVQFLVKQYF